MVLFKGMWNKLYYTYHTFLSNFLREFGVSFKLSFFFFREFQPMASAPDNSSLNSFLLSDQDINQFLV